MKETEYKERFRSYEEIGYICAALEILSPRFRAVECSKYYNPEEAEKLRVKYSKLNKLYCDMSRELTFGIFKPIDGYKGEDFDLDHYFNYMKNMPLKDFLVMFTGIPEAEINRAFISYDGRRRLFNSKIALFGTTQVAEALFTDRNGFLSQLYSMVCECRNSRLAAVRAEERKLKEEQEELARAKREEEKRLALEEELKKAALAEEKKRAALEEAEKKRIEEEKKALEEEKKRRELEEKAAEEEAKKRAEVIVKRAMAEEERAKELALKKQEEEKAAQEAQALAARASRKEKEDAIRKLKAIKQTEVKGIPQPKPSPKPVEVLLDPETGYPEGLKLLADKTRFVILNGLKEKGEMSGQEIAGKYDLAASTVSHHMTQMRDLGLVNERHVNVTKYYSVNKAGIEALLKAIKDNFCE